MGGSSVNMYKWMCLFTTIKYIKNECVSLLGEMIYKNMHWRKWTCI